MIDPSLEMQRAVLVALNDHDDLTSLVGTRIWDRVPTTAAGAVYPQITMGPSQVVNDGNGCGDQVDAFLQIDCWSRAPGYAEARQISAEVCAALNVPLAVTGHRVVVQDIEDIRYRREPDGLTSRAIIGLRVNLVPST